MRRPHPLLGALATIGLVLALGASPAAAQADDGSAQLRLAHLSPDAPAMDVYVAGFDGREQLVLPGVAYGQVSQYLPLGPGAYTFSMRTAGSPATEPAVITASAQLDDGTAYTFAALGAMEAVRTTLYADDLSNPPPGQGRIRLIQAASSSPQVDVQVVEGPTLAAGASFPTATGYAAVPAGSWQIEVTPSSGGPTTRQRLEVAAGTVASLVVLDGQGSGGLRLTSVVDAVGMAGTTTPPAPTPGDGAVPAAPTASTPGDDAVPAAPTASSAASAMPVGGVDTGFGGASPALAGSGGGGVAVALLLGAAAVAVVAASVRPVLRPRTVEAGR